jgi:hypothetical protein
VAELDSEEQAAVRGFLSEVLAGFTVEGLKHWGHHVLAMMS